MDTTKLNMVLTVNIFMINNSCNTANINHITSHYYCKHPTHHAHILLRCLYDTHTLHICMPLQCIASHSMSPVYKEVEIKASSTSAW